MKKVLTYNNYVKQIYESALYEDHTGVEGQLEKALQDAFTKGEWIKTDADTYLYSTKENGDIFKVQFSNRMNVTVTFLNDETGKNAKIFQIDSVDEIINWVKSNLEDAPESDDPSDLDTHDTSDKPSTEKKPDDENFDMVLKYSDDYSIA